MPSTSEYIVHICPRADWEAARRSGLYRPASLETEGFIHLSRPSQVLTPANALYANRRDLLILWVHPRKLTAPLKWEAVAGEVYPHLYGALPLEAVCAVTEFPPDTDGVFRRVSPPAEDNLRC